MVLIADTEMQFLDLAKRFLIQYGYEWLVLESGIGGLQFLESEQPKVVVLDDELGWGGCEGVVEFMQGTANHSHTSIVLTTTVAPEEASFHTDHNVKVSWYTKPFLRAWSFNQDRMPWGAGEEKN